MRILLVGSGGREHALALKLTSSPTPVELFLAPGSDAMGELGSCVPSGTDLLVWCETYQPDLVVVGPEAPLVAGLADEIRQKGIPVFGHDRATAQLEGSKAFAKAFMARHGIPCAAGSAFSELSAAEEAIRRSAFPLAVKADGLAGGKGVVLCAGEADALEAVRSFMGGRFGEASRRVVLEEGLHGTELSLHVLADVGRDHLAYALLPACQDHKRACEGDRGPNTGGMGAYGPLPFLGSVALERMRRELVEPTLRGCQEEGLEVRGVFYFCVMWTTDGPKVLEYNVRFGDPEAQVILELLDEDLPRLLLEVAEGRFSRDSLHVRPGCALAVVLASEGYPNQPRTGDPIEIHHPDARVIHAGTRKDGGRWVTWGGRVLNLVVHEPDLEQARTRMDAALTQVQWPGMQFRRDIGVQGQRIPELG